MPNRYMLPFDANEGITQLQIGFQNNYDNYGLDKIADCCTVPGEADTVLNSDHAIPSVIAHILQFSQLLRDKNETAVNEWRGMLAVLLFRCYCGNVTELELDLSTSDLGKIILKKISPIPYNWQGDKMVFFLFNGKPFAFAVPGIGICPCKKYDKSMFDSIAWYSYQPNGTSYWKNVIAEINPEPHMTTKLGKILYAWLSEQNINTDVFNSFKTDALNNSNITPDQINDILRDLKTNDGNFVQTLTQNSIQNIARYFRAPEIPYPFSDKLLIYEVPENINIESTVQYAEVNRNYPVSRGNKALIIPPFRDEFAAFCKDIDHNDLTVTYVTQDPQFIVCNVMINHGEICHKKSKTYETRDIVKTNNLPFLSLWPNVALPPDKWKCYYLFSVPAEKTTQDVSYFDGRLFELNAIGGSEFTKHEVNTEFEEGLGSSGFMLYYSTSIFRSVGLKYNNLSYGQIFINHGRQAGSLNHADYRQDVSIGIDFGTTSTNCYIKSDDNNCVSIESPGKYFLEILPTDPQESALERDLKLVTTRTDILNKFFTVGQIFSHTPVRKPHVGGRAFFLDQKIWQFFRRNNPTQRNVYFDLKHVSIANRDDAKRRTATEYFLKNILLIAVLQARLAGADIIKLYYSYPFKQQLGNVRETWDAVFTFLRETVGIDDKLSTKEVTEAEAAGYFYANSDNLGEVANFENGFAIVDIGGGTTDVSIWQEKEGSEEDLRAQCSIRYAGNMLVRRTIVQTIRNEHSFGELWINRLGQEAESLKGLIGMYNEKAASIPRPLNQGTPDYYNCANILDMIIETSSINTDQLSNSADYNSFRAAVKLKYMCVFYIIADYLKAKSDTEDGFTFPADGNTFYIYLAGCGSKGLKFCIAANNLCNFSESSFGLKIVKMMCSVIGIEDETQLRIIPPVSETKEEVVKGLNYYETRRKAVPAEDITVGIEVDGVQADEADGNADTKKKAEIVNRKTVEADAYTGRTRPMLDRVIKEYNTLISIIKTNSDANEYLIRAGEPSLIDQMMYEKVRQIFVTKFNGISARLREFNPPDVVLEKYIAVLIFDEVLDEKLAKL